MDAKPGDMIHFRQDDGNVITIICGMGGGVAVKAESPGTNLDLRRDSSFCYLATAVGRETSYHVQEGKPGALRTRVTAGPFDTLCRAQTEVPRSRHARIVRCRGVGEWETVFEWSVKSRCWMLA